MHNKEITYLSTLPSETPEEIARDVYAIARIDAIPLMLGVLCEITGMGFAAVARVSDVSWTVCAVKDKIQFGLKPGDQLPLESTLCVESKRTRDVIVIDRASSDPLYCNHHTPKLYQIESYISVPIVLSNGHYFGNLCAVDPSPAIVSAPAITNIFKHFAALIACQLASEDVVDRTDSVLRAERAASEWRDSVIADLGETLLNPVRAISDASDTIDSQATDASAVKGLATRIRTNALRISSLLERLLNFSRPRDVATLRPKLEGAWNFEEPSDQSGASSDRIDRETIESLLMQRVGELRSHLGRFDMYALALTKWLEGKTPVDPQIARLTIGTRGVWISRRLQLLAMPGSIVVEFEDINRELLSVLARHEIAARNTASIPSLRTRGVPLFPAADRKRDWYDHRGASDQEMSDAIDAMDKEIVLVAALYIRLAGLAGKLSLIA